MNPLSDIIWGMTEIEHVEAFYDKQVQREWQRMERHPVEFELTKRALQAALPPSPITVLDIGGGPGRYSIWLAGLGYLVTLADLSTACLEFAKTKAAEAGVQLAGVVHANALDLSAFADASFDAVLLMGPLYHLLEEEERLGAVREAVRVLRPGGLLAAAFITRYAPFRDALKDGQNWVYEDVDYSWYILRTGRNDRPDGFTRAYFANPDEVEPLMVSAGLQRVDFIGCEGMVPPLEDKLSVLSFEQQQLWMAMNESVCRDPALRGAADHLLYIGRK